MIPGLSHVLYHGGHGTGGVTGFPNIGTIVIFCVVLVPVYVMVAAWFAGKPRDSSSGLLGISYLIGITAQMWIGMLIVTLIISVVFYGGLPEPFSSVGP